jgi:hypothetical protein
MTEFQLDTSGAIYENAPHYEATLWKDLSPFTQGYIEALLAGLPFSRLAFHMLAPETLARIIADCEAMQAKGLRDTPEVGRSAWEVRQMGATDFPPLTVQLSDYGKVGFE